MASNTSAGGLPNHPETLEQQVNRIYDLTRKRIEHEDELLNQRMTWLTVSQGLFAIGIGAVSNVSNEWTYAYILGIAVLGFVVSSCALIGIRYSDASVKELISWWNDYKLKEASTIHLPQVQFHMIGISKPRLNARYATYGLPIIAAVVWGLLCIFSSSQLWGPLSAAIERHLSG